MDTKSQTKEPHHEKEMIVLTLGWIVAVVGASSPGTTTKNGYGK
jgi:hypothetical protein